jgi:predicted NBD/HSP70 family sugar kinase
MKAVFIGTDSGATTSKTGGVFADGQPVTLKLAQSVTPAQQGTAAVVAGWVAGVEQFLAENGLTWRQVAGVGLALPGPYQAYGVLDRTPNLPLSFAGWHFHDDYAQALAARAGRPIPLVAGNDGNYGGVGEAARVRGNQPASVIMLAPGSGLGAAYIDRAGLPLEGDMFCGMEAGHMPAPLHLLGLPPFLCGCGRTWGCFEAYTSLAGLPQLLDHLLPHHPHHALAKPGRTPKEKALALRGLAQQGDALACEIFDIQAKALGLHVANLSIALDAEFVVIGGGLMDPESTSSAFRERYLNGIREAAMPWLYPLQRQKRKIVPATLGELSQAIGAALVALYSSQVRDAHAHP